MLSAAALCLLVASNCARTRQEADQTGASAPQEAAKTAVPADQEPSPRFIRVSVYVTDAGTNEPVSDAEVVIGAEQLLPTPLPIQYGDDPAGLYATETLEGGTYLFRVRRAGYRSVVGRLDVPPVPERIVGNDPPLVLEPEDTREAGESGKPLRTMVLWQKYLRNPPEQSGAPHPPMPKAGGVSPHIVDTHPLETAPESTPPRQ